jgi:hypothetical protein
VVLIAGEAGIGKSRLTAALLERLAGEPHTRLRYFCSPQHTDSALYPIIGQMERAAGLAHDDTLQARLDKLDTLLAQTSTSIGDASLFAEMLSLPNDGRYPALELTPQQHRQRTFEALISQLEALTRQSPVLIIFEDAHWTDPTSLEAFGRIVARIETLRALMIVIFRPEFDPPWIGRQHVTAMTINRLTKHSVPGLGSPRKFARLIDVAARPARPRQRSGTDWRGDRPGVFACSPGGGGARASGGTGISAEPSHKGWFAFQVRLAAECNLPIQACFGAGRVL